MGAATESKEIQFKFLKINLQANEVQFKLGNVQKWLRVHLVLSNENMVLYYCRVDLEYFCRKIEFCDGPIN